MGISQTQAAEALAVIQGMERRTRRSIAAGGAPLFLVATGCIWLVGFLANQFLAGPLVTSIWVGTSVVGSAVAVVCGVKRGRRVRGTSTGTYARRIGLFWLVLALLAIALIAVARPADDRQFTMMIILLMLFGQWSMGLLFSFRSSWWAVPIAGLALLGYLLLPGIFYLWMGVLVGGSMIALGAYIALRW